MSMFCPTHWSNIIIFFSLWIENLSWLRQSFTEFFLLRQRYFITIRVKLIYSRAATHSSLHINVADWIQIFLLGHRYSSAGSFGKFSIGWINLHKIFRLHSRVGQYCYQQNNNQESGSGKILFDICIKLNMQFIYILQCFTNKGLTSHTFCQIIGSSLRLTGSGSDLPKTRYGSGLASI